MIQRIALLLSVFLLTLLLSPFSVAQADEPVGYSVKADLPENQLNDGVSYFDLRVEPGQEQDLTVMIYNHENEEIIVQAAIYNASTNSNGLMIYEEQEEPDSSLQNPITALVTLKNDRLAIPAGESTAITATLKIPDEPFDGVKLGGIHFEKVPEDQKAGEGVQIQNKYAYVVGLQISENDEEVSPELSLTAVAPQLVNHRTAVVAQIQNSQPLLMGNLTVQAKVYEEGSTEPMRETELNDIRMAPNSTMDFVIDWNNRSLKEGSYRLEMMATDGENEWDWQDEFLIEEGDEAINDSAVELESDDNQHSWYIAGISVLSGIIILLTVYIQRLKREK